MKSLFVIITTLNFVLILFIGCRAPEEYDYTKDPKIIFGKSKIYAALDNARLSKSDLNLNIELDPNLKKPESYNVSLKDSLVSITGADAAGLMYGCLEVSDSISKNNRLPESLNMANSPLMSLRGVCILLMKLGTYNYPVTPEEFPFFYDKKLWIDYLDFLVANKYNYIAFWNGHPFAYFTKLDKYPEAQEGMPDGLVQRNNKMLHWLIAESNKRNIKLIFEFYNIHTSVYFQNAHDLDGEIKKPTPLLKEYTSYCIEKFITEFPDAGLYITAGEALDQEYSVEWVTNVILDAVKRSGQNTQILLRSWFIDLENAKQILDYHPNIFIERKYNVEMIADTLIDPRNKKWANLSGNFIMNIHMAANLEPFRWNPPAYIQKCMQNSAEAGANGLHLYPRKSWRWPYAADVGAKSLQWERDKLWYEMWGRYAWNYERSVTEEQDYWVKYFSREFGSVKTAKLALGSFEKNADVLPAIQRLFWAGHDNHTVVTSGLMLNQLERAGGIPFLPLDPVIRVPEYLEKISKGITLTGTSPLTFLAEKVSEAEQATVQLEDALNYAKDNIVALNNYLADAKSVELTVKFYFEKLNAAAAKASLSFRSTDKTTASKFLKHLQNSVEYYRELTRLTKGQYESISDVSALHPLSLKVLPFHWEDILPIYEQEYQVYFDEINQQGNPKINKPVLNGLIGVIYGSPGLVNPKIIMNSETLEFDWAANPPDEGRNWSAEFSGFIQGPISGNVEFHVSCQQSVKLIVDKKTLMDKSAEVSGEIAQIKMAAGKWIPISIEYDNNDFKGSNLKINWSWDGGQITTIGPEYLKHSEYNNKKVNRTLVLGF